MNNWEDKLNEISLNQWLEQEKEDLEEGKRLLDEVSEYGINSFYNYHVIDDNGNLETDDKGNIIRE